MTTDAFARLARAAGLRTQTFVRGLISGCFLAGLTLALACSSKAEEEPAGPAAAAVQTESIDCTANGPCGEIVIAGDPAATLPDGRPSNARGYADPSLRRDPATGTIWMAYSYPQVTLTPGASRPGHVSIDSHLARSLDDGASWSFVRPLWISTDRVDGFGRSGRVNQETVALAVRETPGGSVWYSARFSYLSVDARPTVTSFVIKIATASSPELLSQVEEATLGGDLTDAFWQPDVNLASLSPELAGCTFFDAGLIFHDSRLYLAAQCILYTQAGETPENEFIAVFATNPQGGVHGWTWRYLGKLTTYSDAVQLGGADLRQTDLVLGRDGHLLAIVSPSQPASPLASHFGCRVLEIESLDPPRLARDSEGFPLVRANIAASDLAPTGPAACGYDPGSKTGVVIVRRVLGAGQLIVTLHSTGLQP